MHDIFFGKVIHGLGRGKSFGFPTINIELIHSSISIESGVYVVSVTVNEQLFKGMLYVGTRPTFDMKEITIEVHILDFDEDIYNLQISFKILHKIREEIQFNCAEKLIEQLHQDKEMVNNFFKNSSNLELF